MSVTSDAFSSAALRAFDSCACSLLSSSATRAWVASSRVWARDLSVYGEFAVSKCPRRKRTPQSRQEGEHTSPLACNDSRTSCETPTGPLLRGCTCQQRNVSSFPGFPRISYAFHTCADWPSAGFDELEPMLSSVNGCVNIEAAVAIGGLEAEAGVGNSEVATGRA